MESIIQCGVNRAQSPHIVSVAAVLHCICRDLDAYIEGPFSCVRVCKCVVVYIFFIFSKKGQRKLVEGIGMLNCRIWMHEYPLLTGMDIDSSFWKGLR